MAIWEATTLERTTQGRRSSGRSSTMAADVSSHEVSMPRTRIRSGRTDFRRTAHERGQRLLVWRTGNALLGHDGGDVLRGRHVEGGIPNARTFRRQAVRAHVRDLAVV